MTPDRSHVGRLVRLADGRTGRLLRVDGSMGEVLMPGERWVRCPLDKLEVI